MIRSQNDPRGAAIASKERAPLRKLSVIMPAKDESERIGNTIGGLCRELRQQMISFEVLVVVDSDRELTWEVLQRAGAVIPELRPMHNTGESGFGRAVGRGLEYMTGDAAVIMMADGSDDCRDVVRYWRELNKGYDCVFGSRFIKGGSASGYPFVKRILNRTANTFVRLLFAIELNDTTNAFKAYRREVIEGCRPLSAAHFDITVELPLKAIVRGFTWTMIPVAWRGRSVGAAKFRVWEMGRRYLSVILNIWAEKHLSRGE